ncbi:bifunctional 2-polyprenyl-6-hydroxyphenol methylase/3-demethylubiquinol 3-O-methyltransferase UbiG [Ammoniphilus sp. CFH 90114]|uniref:class I SAM-dependent methyltransferase n=1 Tax=Ammoniphilus sp. CFH 90114 TaxID=2493665 RepID=UPI00100DFBF9|nr:methyltransferase domain-containing protein [Ammoniphilus sp. CFH 90114]RXT07942.1 methyltransferase domain-containing protein [Ammoniphilus sp. CFH 90114]
MTENQKIIEAFTKSLPDYLRDVETTSGKLFYTITWNQIAEHLAQNKTLNILDIGCGFGLTSIWLAEQGHLVTGVDMTPDMIRVAEQKAKEKKQEITFLQGQLENIDDLLEGKTYDWILCHNVLGYLDRPTDALGKLYSLLNPGGYISIITHNPAGKVLKKAIVEMDLFAAKEMMNREKEYNPLIGAYVHQYSLTTFLTWFEQLSLKLVEHYGVRCVFDYTTTEIQDNPKIFQDLLELELQLGQSGPYKDIAFFYHFILQKKV